ncbi:glycine zipper 2TM domain-containing protein [Pseudoduganella danionis]|uniref:Glycine zipper 2TM domain-containing protein n=1 Tax=Pseudoduganella danionis TaxID=1890295 RepID=A0ABW9SKN3_9BURK|nr:glycine zipper 2TM domain-containing protein [Pseudoduganella danionis]MTW32225.1 glycine zipper 2TM domain-containing protein [Pseudoduganella danionis]
MRTKSTTLSLLLASAALLGGCASNQPAVQQGYYANQSDAASYGTVDAIKVVAVNNSNSGAGAVAGGVVGALLGNQVGSGSGRTAATVAGAVGGAVVGNNIESQRKAQTRQQYQISVRMDNGDYRIVNQDALDDLRVGNRVRLIDGRVYRY